MRQSKFTLNAFILIVIIFSAMLYFFALVLVNLSDWGAVNEVNAIEGTDLSIIYSDKKPNGLYQGNPNDNNLKLKGNFGHDWGLVIEGDYLYTNEYTSTNLGFMLCRLVRIDLHTYEKETLYTDTILRGRCKSGELVCVKGFVMPSNSPGTNSLFKLYGMTSSDLTTDNSSQEILFLDPADSSVVYSIKDRPTDDKAFEIMYLQKTLEEIQK